MTLSYARSMVKITAPPSNKSQTVGMNSEIDLLLCCIRKHNAFSVDAEHIRSLLQQNLNWDNLIAFAKFHKVIPLLYQNLNSLCPEIVPEKILIQLKTLVFANTFRNLFLTQELLDILKLFKKNGIPTIAFKGLTLSIEAYQDLSFRQVGDLDLLLPKNAIEQAKEILITEGFQLIGNYEWEFHFFRMDGNVHVDLHQEIAPRLYNLPYDFDQLLLRTKPLTLGSESIPSLAVEDHLLLLSIVWCRDCAYRNSHFSLHLLCDANALITSNPQLDWIWIFNQAETLGCDRILRLMLTSAHSLLKTDLPTEILNKLVTKPLPTSLIRFIESRLFSISEHVHPLPENPGFWEFLWSFNHRFYLQTREHFPDKTIYCLRWLWMCIQVAANPNKSDWNLVLLPKPLSFLYYPIHVLRLFSKHVLTPLKNGLIDILKNFIN
jgi:hypothetical protein